MFFDELARGGSNMPAVEWALLVAELDMPRQGGGQSGAEALARTVTSYRPFGGAAQRP